MTKNDGVAVLGLLIGVLFILLIGFSYVAENEELHLQIETIRKEAVEVGAAEYDSTTGKWQWKRNAEKK